jgi:pimeloyl-ACP methyl ester carboxylesterase
MIYHRMSKYQSLVFLLAGLLILFSLWNLSKAERGLIIERASSAGIPYQVYQQQGSNGSERPLILIAHGLAGSGIIMKGFALTLAHAGYTVVTWDFNGHAGNNHPMEADIYQPWLLQNVEEVYTAVLKKGLVDSSRIAIVGHSMGTAAALNFAQAHAHVRATVAVSPVQVSVTPTLPQNLLLLAGALEPQFVTNAENRLKEAGGVSHDLLDGSARDLQILPGLEHISIIFAPQTHHLALTWFDQTFGKQPQASVYRDHRLLWFLMVMIGTLAVAVTISSSFSSPKIVEADISRSRGVLILAVSALSATFILWLFDLIGLPVNTLLGLRTGGYLVIWFLISGIIGLLLLKKSVPRPSPNDLFSGLLIFIIIWLGIGLVGGTVWLPWLLIPQRLMLFPLIALALFPWFYFMGTLQAAGGVKLRLSWWLIGSLIICLGLLLSIKITSGLGFLILLLPLFPLVLLIHTIPNIPQKGSWSFALSGSLFVGWMTLAVFPLI